MKISICFSCAIDTRVSLWNIERFKWASFTVNFFILIWHAEIPIEHAQFHAVSVLFHGPTQKQRRIWGSQLVTYSRDNGTHF